MTVWLWQNVHHNKLQFAAVQLDMLTGLLVRNDALITVTGLFLLAQARACLRYAAPGLAARANKPPSVCRLHGWLSSCSSPCR
jgi:hypothetical protein